MNSYTVLLVSLATSVALAACSGKNGGDEDSGQDADAPSDMTETTDPDIVEPDVLTDAPIDPDAPMDVPTDEEADPDGIEDVPGDMDAEESTCTGPAPAMSDVRITNASDDSTTPSLAWTGSEFGVSWTNRRDGNNETYFARISSAGSKVGTDVRITTASTESIGTSLSWTGSEFGVSWVDSRDGNREIYFARISSAGSKIGADVRITTASTDSIDPSLSWTGSEFGVSWVDSRDGNEEIYFARISSAGSKVGADVRISSDSGRSRLSSLAWTGSEFGVTWQDDRDGNTEVYFARISSTGSKVGADVRMTTDIWSSLIPALVWTGSEFGVSWMDHRDSNYEIYFARISSSGSKVGSDVRITSAAEDSTYPTLTWIGSEFGVSWGDYRDGNFEIYFARISPSGTKIGSDVRITSASQESWSSSLVWTGSEFGVSWEDHRDGDPEIYFNLISYCP